VKRGDRNGDAALDREEVRAIASSSPVPGEGTGIPPVTRQVHVTVLAVRDPGLTGLIDDLKLPPDRRVAALAALAQAEEDTTGRLVVSLDTLRDEVRALVTEGQLAALEKGIQTHRDTVRGLLAQTAAPCCRLSVPISAVEIDRAVGALGLAGDALARVHGAIDRHLERTVALATDRSGLLRRVTPVLTSEELADFAASLERHSAIVSKAETAPR